MLSTRTEWLAAALVLLILLVVPAWLLKAESRAAHVGGIENPHVITLTAIADGGIWTEEDVVGHSYWRRRPKPARPVVRVGETVVIRLKSADVRHSFSIPDLEVGPVSVEPGHVSEVRFVPREPGEYLTQCSTRCGPCHEEMLGTIVVLGPGQTLADHPGGLIPPRKKCHLGDQP
ncbi:MAG: hypothetical protein HY720_02550 [Planctomycetes bacterium]|nr:hypothetical protein [Planctomycetota bacterium]